MSFICPPYLRAITKNRSLYMNPVKYEIFYLDNGLKVIVHEDHSIPKTVMNLVYRVGAKDEAQERTGFAHLFEHLMFGGSKNIKEFDTPLLKVGGTSNAFTNNDITNYYLSLPSNQLETGFWLESDRMLELDFSQKSLDVQKSVVIEEFKQRYLNKPYGDAHLLLRPVHFKKHPYRWPTIGMDISHIEKATLEDVKEFFYGFYAPNNATLVVAGDVTLDQVKRLAEKWFGPIPNRTLNKKELPVEPIQKEARELTVHRDVPHAGVYKMYHIPGKSEDGYYAADLLTDILTAGKASRLYQALVKEKRVASRVSAFSWGAYHPGMISIDASLPKGVDSATYEAALYEIVDELQSLKSNELQRVKNSIETQYALNRTRILNRAMFLAMSDTLDDVELINTSLQKYLDVSTDIFHESARNILNKNNCSTLYYLPSNGSLS